MTIFSRFSHWKRSEGMGPSVFPVRSGQQGWKYICIYTENLKFEIGAQRYPFFECFLEEQ